MKAVLVRWVGLLGVASVLLAGSFWFTTELASAQTLPLGSQIVCFVYQNLNAFGSPIPVLTAPGCAATSTPPGGGNLEVITTVNGGSSSAADFDVHVESAGVDISGSPQLGSASGTTYIGLDPATYAVSESGAALSDYTITFGGSCNASGDVTVAAGATAVCTITDTFTGGSGTGGTGSSGTGSLTGTVTGTSSLTGTVGTSTGLTGTVGTSTSSLTGTVSSTSTLSGTVGSGNTLTGSVSGAGSSGGGVGGGGGGGGTNGPIAGGGGGGGGSIIPTVTTTPPGRVLGASTGPSTPGIPNTGAGGSAEQNLMTLLVSGIAALGGVAILRRRLQQ